MARLAYSEAVTQQQLAAPRKELCVCSPVNCITSQGLKKLLGDIQERPTARPELASEEDVAAVLGECLDSARLVSCRPFSRNNQFTPESVAYLTH